MGKLTDPILRSIIKVLVDEQRCHTVILYGSRARGLTTPTSDYDVIGIRKTGKKFRIAKKQNGFFWDVFVYSEKDLKTLNEEHFSWKSAKILFQKGTYGTSLLKRLDKLLQKPYKVRSDWEINVIKIWSEKEFERCKKDDIQGLFRRAEFLAALVDHYFFIRQKRFLGPKEGFDWIKTNDPKTYKLIKRALKYPTNLSFLKSAAVSVYRRSIV